MGPERAAVRHAPRNTYLTVTVTLSGWNAVDRALVQCLSVHVAAVDLVRDTIAVIVVGASSPAAGATTAAGAAASSGVIVVVLLLLTGAGRRVVIIILVVRMAHTGESLDPDPTATA
jgi:hypothetical protein